MKGCLPTTETISIEFLSFHFTFLLNHCFIVIITLSKYLVPGTISSKLTQSWYPLWHQRDQSKHTKKLIKVYKPIPFGSGNEITNSYFHSYDIKALNIYCTMCSAHTHQGPWFKVLDSRYCYNISLLKPFDGNNIPLLKPFHGNNIPILNHLI